jgi:hypothetical protein
VLVNGITPEKSSRWLWPPQICMRAFYFYCENVDPALQVRDGEQSLRCPRVLNGRVRHR